MSEWIKHDGGPCPVAGDVRVDVKLAGASPAFGKFADVWSDGDDWWQGDCEPEYAITHYRLSQSGPPAAPEPDLRAKFDRFDEAAKDWGWQADQGTTGVAESMAEYEAAKADLLAAIGLA